VLLQRAREDVPEKEFLRIAIVLGPFLGNHLLQVDRKLIGIEGPPLAHLVTRDGDSVPGFKFRQPRRRVGLLDGFLRVVARRAALEFVPAACGLIVLAAEGVRVNVGRRPHRGVAQAFSNYRQRHAGRYQV
jgi:hypothetical protein